MPNPNKANRQVCNVNILTLKDMKPFLYLDTANTTTAGISGDNSYAMAKGTRRISFANPLESTMSITCQVFPFKLYSMLSDGSIENTATYAEHKVVDCATKGELPLVIANGSIVDNKVFAYPAGSFGVESAAIEATYAGDKLTGNFEDGNSYEIGYIVSKTSGVKKISFNNKKLPKDFYITMETVDKDEDGLLTGFRIVAYKACIKRNLELSFSSEGDPMELTLEYDLMEDKDGNVLDFIELEDEE